MNDLLDDARLCLVLSTALLAIACGVVFAMTGGDAQSRLPALLLPGLVPLRFLVPDFGVSGGSLAQAVTLMLATIISFGCYFAVCLGLVRGCRHVSNHHHANKV